MNCRTMSTILSQPGNCSVALPVLFETTSANMMKSFATRNNSKFYLAIGANLSRRQSSTHAQAELHFSNGRKLTLSTGKYARFANGTAECRMGDTSVMVTAVAKDKPSGANFMPLTVDFRQKYAAAGRIPTNFLRRELGKSDKEILSARLIDRSLRPLFDATFRCETQMVCNMLALDAVYQPDVLSINAASLALSMSDVPWNGPVGAVRLGLIENEIIINPTRRELQLSSLDLILTSSKNDLVVMLEGKANVVPYQTVVKAIRMGLLECRTIIGQIEKLQKKHGKPKRSIEETTQKLPIEVIESLKTMSEMRISEVFHNRDHDKLSRDVAIREIRDEVVNKVCSSFTDLTPIEKSLATEEFNRISKAIFREIIFNDGRCDGRQLDELRNISCDVDLYPPLHGSAIFQRGQTQVLATVSLDSLESALKLDNLSALEAGVKSKNFFLHYEFPPYATGEIGRIGPIGRREIGHGALAEKGLMPIIPSDYPFAIRLTSEVLESNGSSSMATVCAGTLALLDAGVPITQPAAGVAIGLVTKYKDDDPFKLEEYKIITDILGIEDYLGDMDMKVAATKDGVTAIQADIKTYGIPLKVVDEALGRAMTARTKILKIMNDRISIPSQRHKYCWPVVDQITVEPGHRSTFVGQGGMNLKKVYLETGCQLSQIDEKTFNIFAPSQSAMDEAMDMIKNIMKKEEIPKFEFGAIYTAKIVNILDSGIMVKLYESQKPTMIGTHQLDNRKVAHPTALGLEIGQDIKVKFFGYDPVSGFMRLSRKSIGNTSAPVY